MTTEHPITTTISIPDQDALLTPAPNLSLSFKGAATPQQRDLAEAYWTLGQYSWQFSETQLAKHFGLKKPDVWPTVNLTSTAVHPHLCCSRCSKPYSYSSRSDYEQIQNLKTQTYTCPVCVGEQKHQRTEVIRRECALDRHEPLDLTALSLLQALFLVALVQERSTPDHRAILAGNETQEATPLTLNPEQTHELFMSVYQRDFLYIHPSSPVEAFLWKDEIITGFSTHHTRWTLTVGPQSGFTETATRLESLVTDMSQWPQVWHDELEAVMLTLLHQEALANLKLQLKRRHLPTEASDEHQGVLRQMLQTLSLGQVWNISWQSTASASDWRITTPGITAEKAGKAVVTHLKKRAERYRVQGPKPSPRDHELPVPALSHVLFVQTLGYTEQGYAEVFQLGHREPVIPPDDTGERSLDLN